MKDITSMQIPQFSGKFKVDMKALTDKYDFPFDKTDKLRIQQLANRDAEALIEQAKPYAEVLKPLSVDLYYTGEGPHFWSQGYDPFQARIEIRREGSDKVLHTVKPDKGYTPYRASGFEKFLSAITFGLFEDLDDKRPARAPETEAEFIQRAVKEGQETADAFAKASKLGA